MPLCNTTNVLLPRNEQDEGEEGHGSRWDQLKAPQVQRNPAVWDREARLQPELEAGESTTAVENFLRDTSPKDPATQGLQQLQTGGVNNPSDEDAREAGTCTSPPPGELIFGPAPVCLPVWHWGGRRCNLGKT